MATTISNSTATTTTTTPQRVDYISALNAGSGLNTTQIVDTLVNAEILPKQTKINEQVESKNISISSLGQVKSDFTSFDTNLALLADQNGLLTASSSTAIEIIPDNTASLSAFVHEIDVTTLAKAHTLSFSGFNSATETVPEAGTLIFSIGSYSGDTFTADADINPQMITMTAATTIADIASQINSFTGMDLTASVVKTESNTYSLMVKSATGLEKQIEVVARNGVNAEISQLNFDTPSLDGAKQIVPAVDASFSFDGLTITRPSNTISDLIDGVTLKLKTEGVNNVEIGAAYDKQQALDVLTAFVTEINTLRTTMSNMTAMGSDAGDEGPLRGDMLIRSYLNRLKSITTTPIENYKDDPVFLSNFGVMTELDGSLSIDTIKFGNYFEQYPADFAALTQNRVSSGSGLVKATGSGSLYKAGTYDLSLSSTDSRVTFSGATLDGVAMVLENGIFKADSANTLGINIEPTTGAPDTKIYVGTSLLQSLRDFSKTVLTPGNAIDGKISTYSDEIAAYEDELTKLDTVMETTRTRYTTQFAQMEAAVASFKKTGEYLTNFMESWRAGLD